MPWKQRLKVRTCFLLLVGLIPALQRQDLFSVPFLGMR